MTQAQYKKEYDKIAAARTPEDLIIKKIGNTTHSFYITAIHSQNMAMESGRKFCDFMPEGYARELKFQQALEVINRKRLFTCIDYKRGDVVRIFNRRKGSDGETRLYYPLSDPQMILNATVDIGPKVTEWGLIYIQAVIKHDFAQGSISTTIDVEHIITN